MKKIDVKYNKDGYIEEVSDNSIHFEQENGSLQIDAHITTDKKVRAYIKSPNNNSTVTDELTPVDGVYSCVVEGDYMAKGTLYVGYELYDDTGYVERLEPLKVYIDSFVNLGGGSSDNVYVVTIKVGNVKTLANGEPATVENAGTKKDMILNFGLPRGEQGIKGDKGDTGPKGEKGEQGIQGIQGVPGKDGYTPVKGVDYFTAEDIKSLGIEKKADKTELPTKLSQLTDDITEQSYNYASIKPQSGKAVAEAIAKLLGSAPENLDTLEELAKALNEDENFSATVLAEIAKKVDKEDGKGLSTNDFTNTLKEKLTSLFPLTQGDYFYYSIREDLISYLNSKTGYGIEIIEWNDHELYEESEYLIFSWGVTWEGNIGCVAYQTLLYPNGKILRRTRSFDEESEWTSTDDFSDEWQKISVSQTDLNKAIGDIETSLENIITKYGLGGDDV